MFGAIRKAEYAELLALFFIHGAALGMWFVPLSPVLEAHGYSAIRPYAFATSALAAFVSPLIFGAMADRHASPVKVLRWLAFATAASMALASLAIHSRWPSATVLILVQLHALCSAPTFSISSTIVLSRLSNAQQEFGPVRAMATLGWMGGCVVVSALNADTSTLSGFSGSIAWLGMALMTWFLPITEAPKAAANLSWQERLGLDALTLLRNRDHRVVFITSSLFCIPLTAFYVYSPPQLRELGFERTTAWMSLGQVTEIVAMFSLGFLMLRWRLKWIFAVGLGFGILRFLLSALNVKSGVLGGVILHGCSYTLVIITTQIYLEQRVDPAWRARAQALLALMNNGVGNLLGYLSTGWWFRACTSKETGTHWPYFWTALAGVVALVMAKFLLTYRGRPQKP